MRILHFSTHNEACGIGKYQEQFITAMSPFDGVENEFFDVSPNVIRSLGDSDYNQVMNRLVSVAGSFDLVHIQHEWGFHSRDELSRVIDGVHSQGHKVAITMHTSPRVLDLKPPVRRGLSPRAFLNLYRERKLFEAMMKRVISPLLRADMIIVHNSATEGGLIAIGADPAKVMRMTLPVHEPVNVKPASIIRPALRAEDGDVIMCTVGFLHRFKGVDAAIKSLVYLPAQYKLAIIGGINPTSDDTHIFDDLTDLIRDLGLIDRVFITGYVESDDVLDSLIRECDVAVYPYDGVYYSQVTSAALNVSLANGMTTVAYPTGTFKEMGSITSSVVLTPTFSYYELARTIKNLNVTWPNIDAEQYAKSYSYSKLSKDLIGLYETLSA